MELPKRKKIRLAGYDYSSNGAYFVTICTHNRETLFGEIINLIVELNDYGIIVKTNVEKLNDLYNDISVDKYVIMPNHIHFIITICRERIACVPNNDPTKSQLSKMMQVFKSSITKEIHKLINEHNRSLESVKNSL